RSWLYKIRFTQKDFYYIIVFAYLAWEETTNRMNTLVYLIALNIVMVAVSGNWLQSCLDAHNYYRRIHGKPLMKLDLMAISHASRRARQLSLLCAFDHR
ncbi:hypothetical protein B4U80_14802, partial [Leptotrombidium deliense]